MKHQPLKDQSARSILYRLDQSGELLTISEEVDPLYDIAALFALINGTSAVRINRVKGCEIGVFGDILSSLDRIAMALDVSPREIQNKLLASIKAPLAPVVVNSAPVQEIMIDDDVLTSLPVPTFFEKETGPYITAGMIVARDPETGLGNASYARLKVLGPKEAMIGIAPNHHLAMMARKATSKGQKLPFAVVIGAHPAIQLAACLYLGLGDDEIHCAGALLGEPVRLVQARTMDLGVPAEAEIILEGHIHGDEPIVEGLVSEYHGMYENYGSGLRASFTCQTRRSDAMMQVIQPGYHKEHIYLGAVPIAAGLKAALSRTFTNVEQVAVTQSGAGRTNIVVQLQKPRRGQARRVMMACWTAVSIVKNVTIVDVDVDPWDQDAVEWAKMNRMRAERDILIVEDLPADRSEPLEDDGTVTKTGYDATRRDDDRKLGFDKAVPPVESIERMRAMLASQHPNVLLTGSKTLAGKDRCDG